MHGDVALPMDVRAFELMAALEEYDDDIGNFIDASFDAELYRRVTRHVAQIRRCRTFAPELAVPSLALLIAHSQLLERLWRPEGGAAGESALRERRREQAACLRALRKGCVDLLTRQHAACPELGSRYSTADSTTVS